MRTSIATHHGRNLGLWRNLLPAEGLFTVDLHPAAREVRLWWGEDVRVPVRPGDRVVAFGSPWGVFIDQVMPAADRGTEGEAA